jgi:uncharacterized membrane protein YqhA
MSVKSNITELKTTLTGLIIVIMSVAYFAMPYFSENELWEPNKLYAAIASGIGFLLIIAPDKILTIAFGWLRKKTKE